MAAGADDPSQSASSAVPRTPAADAPDPDFSIERINRTEAIAAGVPVQIGNRWGDLRIRTTHRGGLLLQGIVQKIGSMRDEFEITVEQNKDRADITVRALVDEPAGRVDLTVYLPPGHELTATTAAGLAEVKYSGPVHVRSDTGNVIVKTGSSASAQTTSGFISAVLTGSNWRQGSNFVTSSGNIEVVVPEKSAFKLSAVTAGTVRVDVHEDAVTRRETVASGVHMTVNDGDVSLHVASDSGNIIIRTLPMSGPILSDK